MKIVISGTPGTGKTEVSDILGKKLGLNVLHVNEFIKKNKLVDEKGEVDVQVLFKKIKNIDGIIESHLLCEIPLSDVIVILRCNPAALAKRLRGRGYSKEKLRENQEAEALDYCTQVAEEKYYRVVQVDTTKLTTKQVAEKVIDYLENFKTDNPDFSEFFLKDF